MHDPARKLRACQPLADALEQREPVSCLIPGIAVTSTFPRLLAASK
jgi:hypothetical protein